jgi:hypothetical protein
MNTEVENIIKNHDYAELDRNQLAQVTEWASSEEEYSTMRQIILSAASLNMDVAPSPELRNSLMKTFAAAHANAGTAAVSPSKKKDKKIIYLWMRTAAAVAALLLVIFLVYPFFNTNTTNKTVAENNSIQPKPKTKTEEKVKTEGNKDPEDLEGAAVESSVQVAEARQETPTTGPNDGLAGQISSSEVEMFDFDRASSTGLEGAPVTVSSAFGATVASSTESPLDHSDRIDMADLPESSKQIIHERPEILDLLHTSF